MEVADEGRRGKNGSESRARREGKKEKSVRLPEAPLPEGLTIMNQKYSLGCNESPV